MLNGIAKGRAVITRANKKLQVDALKKALGMNHEQDCADNNDICDLRDDSDNKNDSFSNRNNSDLRNLNLRGSSSNRDSNCNKRGLPGEKALPDKYFCEGLPDKLVMEALKELNINDIKDFLMAGGPENTTEQFE